MSVYCNDGFTLVEPLVRAVTGRSYAKFHVAGVAQPQAFMGAQASGGAFTTPTDMGTFLRVFLNGGTVGGVRTLRPSSVAAMGVDQTVGTFDPAPAGAMAYGLGWDTVAEPGLGAVGITAWAKSGIVPQYRAQVVVAPEAGLGVVVMGTTGAGFDPLAIAQRVLLRALAETGRIPSFPEPLPPVAAHVAPVPDGLLGSISGEYASYKGILRVRPEENGSLTLLTFDGRDFKPTTTGLLYRSDGWFTSDALPLASFRLVEGDGAPYLAQRSPFGSKHYLDQWAAVQRVRGARPELSPAWSARTRSCSWRARTPGSRSPHRRSFRGSSSPCRRTAIAMRSNLPGATSRRG